MNKPPQAISKDMGAVAVAEDEDAHKHPYETLGIALGRRLSRGSTVFPQRGLTHGNRVRPAQSSRL